MTGLNELPLELFEKILLGHLRLIEILRLRAVSRRWCVFIDNFSVTSLFFSELAIDHIEDKQRLVVGRFVRNYIKTCKFEAFFGQFGASILNHLKHFRACNLNMKNRSPDFVRVLNSFDQLEQLALIRIECLDWQIKLVMPCLRTCHIEELSGLKNLTLDAVRLAIIKIYFNSFVFHLNLEHSESVDSIELDFYNRCLDRGGFRNLRLLYCECLTEISETFLLGLQRLKEVHLSGDFESLRSLHRQRSEFGRNSLKIFYHGLELDGSPNDYAEFPHSSAVLDEIVIGCMIANYWRLAQQLPYSAINFSFIEKFVLKMPVDFWPRFVNLKSIYVFNKLHNELRFLNFLTNFDDLVKLEFSAGRQSQQLFDHLPYYCQSIQSLVIAFGSNLNLEFVFKFRNLISLAVSVKISDDRFIERIFKDLKCIRSFFFYFNNFKIGLVTKQANRFALSVANQKVATFDRLNDAIAFIKML